MSKDSIKVCCRFRFEVQREDRPFEDWDFDEQNATVKLGSKTFVYDQVLPPHITQEEMYAKVAQSTITDYTNGFNATIFAYGQSGSGKTFSMLGPEEVTFSLEKDFNSVPEEVTKMYGITVRAVKQIFDTINEGVTNGISYKLTCSYIEIYNEHLKCLLSKKPDLKIRESPLGGMYVAEKEERVCKTPENIFECISLSVQNRAVTATNQNARSSRSHTVLLLALESNTLEGVRKTSLLNLVDLAGSERISKTEVEGQSLKEAQKINQSLTTLGMCIMALTTPGSKHIPYRNSKLTLILKESLGGNSKTTLLCTASRLKFHTEESTQTLYFAQRAKAIKNNAKSNSTLGVKELVILVEKLKKEILLLRGQLKDQGLNFRTISDPKLLELIGNDDFANEGEDGIETSTKSHTTLKSTRNSICQLSEEEIVMKYIDLRTKFDQIVANATDKVSELHDQVQGLYPEKIIKEISSETVEKLNEKDATINSLQESLNSEKELRIKIEEELRNEIKKLKTEHRRTLETLDSVKKEKESIEEMIDLNNADIESMTSKLDKKREKYKNAKVEINSLKNQLASRDSLIKELTEKKETTNSNNTEAEIQNYSNENIKLSLEIKDLCSKLEAERELNQNTRKIKENLEIEIDICKKTIVENEKIYQIKHVEYEESNQKALEEINKYTSEKEDEINSLETKVSELNKQLQIIQNSFNDQKTNCNAHEIEIAALKKELQLLKSKQNSTINKPVEIKNSMFGKDISKNNRPTNKFLIEAQNEVKRNKKIEKELFKDNVEFQNIRKNNILSLSPKTVSSRGSIVEDIHLDFTDEEGFKKLEESLIEKENKFQENKQK